MTILNACGLYLVLALEVAESWKRSSLVSAMCALLAGRYVVAVLAAVTRPFFKLNALSPGMIATALIASAIAVGALAAARFSGRERIAHRHRPTQRPDAD